MEWDPGRAQAAFEALDGAFPGDGIVVGLAWIIIDGLLFHNGGTGGFSGDRGVITPGSR